jgi:hypothetical protein
MDTGYVNYLSKTRKRDVLRWTREALGKDVPFVSGTYIEGQSGDAVPLYRREMDVIASFGGIPILFQTSQLHEKSGKEKGGDLSRGVPGISAGAGVRVGQDVCTERRNF